MNKKNKLDGEKFSESINFRLFSLVTFVFFMLFAGLISSQQVLAQVTIDSFDIPTSVNENSDLLLSFTASTDTENPLVYEIYFDGILVANTNEYSVITNYSSAGIHTVNLYASDSESNVSQTGSLEIVNVPMQISISAPSSRTYNARSIISTVSVSTYAQSCNYSLTTPSSQIVSGVMTRVDGQNYNANISTDIDGSYSLSVRCFDGSESQSAQISFAIDTLNPIITSKSYAIDNMNRVTITASTDSGCDCKYDTNDRSYDSMSGVFSTSHGLLHSVQISTLADGSYNYYLKCKNYNNNNIANTASLSFNIVTRPSADITLSKNPPLKAGTYEVRLTTSRAVSVAPTLYYNFNSDTAARTITLAGSGTAWKGYMIIEEDTPSRVGSFHYSGTDFNGNTGTTITSGEIFLVDTTKPIAPSSVDASDQPDGTIKLNWYYDGKESKRFNIYRSTAGEPDYVDYFDSTTLKQYIDRDVIDGVTYYYKIAAVDLADNDGLLSVIMQATSTRKIVDSNIDVGNSGSDNTQSSNVQYQALSPSLVPKVDKLILDFNLALTDIDATKSELNQINDATKLRIISILKIAEGITTAQSTIKGLISQVEDLKNQNLKNSELDVKLNKLKMDMIKAKSLVAEDIIVSEQSSYSQVTQESDVLNAISEVVSINVSKNVMKNYSDANIKLQDDVDVATDVFIFRIKYLGKDEYDRYTLVKKVVTSANELSSVSVIEIIPKSFERQASDLNFEIDGQEKPIIVKEDPVLRWDKSKFTKQTIYYMTNTNTEMSAAKDSRTIVLLKPDFKVSETTANFESEQSSSNGGMLTGLVTFETVNLVKLSGLQWVVILGVGMILGLSAYYVSLDRKEKKRSKDRAREHKIILKPLPVNSDIVPQGQDSGDGVVSLSSIDPAKKGFKQQLMGGTNKLFNTDVFNINNRSNVNNINVARTNTNSAIKTSTTALNVAQNVNNSSNISMTNLHNTLDKANELINSFDYENARVLYNHCMKYFPQISFKNAAEKNDVKLMLEHLYLKLYVYRAIYDSRKHATTKNYNVLAQDIATISKAYTKLYSTLNKVDDDHKDGEKKFIDYVANSKRFLESMAS